MTHTSQLILLGRIVAAHGIRGDVVIESYASEPQAIAAYGPLETEDRARQLEVSVVRVTPKGVIARIAGVGDRTAAEALKGLLLYVERGSLPAAEEGAFYRADLIGLAAEDRDGRRIGTVVAVENYGAGDILELRLEGARKTELIPFSNAFVPVVDVAGGRVVVVLPQADATADDES
ncbi:MAG TPA: ribosome maturation factor RimM [Hyphomicrobium sp.]